MNAHEKLALRCSHITLIRDLDCKDIAPALYERGILTLEQFKSIDQSRESRGRVCQYFLRLIAKPNSKCTFRVFIDILRPCYSFLSDALVKCLKDINADLNKTKINREETDKYSIIYRRVKAENEIVDVTKSVIYTQVPKVNVFTTSGKKVGILAHRLKRLIHDGDLESYTQIREMINQTFQNHMKDIKTPVAQTMCIADMKFMTLYAETTARRVKYDTSLYDDSLFREMETVIPLTSNPRVSSMTFLARYGSAISMKETLDNGLMFLEYAKEHAEYVSPCKDTGMVFYIEINLLTQKYERNPTESMKETIIKTAELAIAQFVKEPEDVQIDYQRMLMLKMVFCYLGIGLFGNKIQNVESNEIDKEKAKRCMDFIEKPEVWNGMEKRRKMLFFIAKAEYYRQQKTTELAKVHAVEAENIARQNEWNAELPNIKNMILSLELEGMNSIHIDSDETHESLHELICDITGECMKSKDL